MRIVPTEPYGLSETVTKLINSPGPAADPSEDVKDAILHACVSGDAETLAMLIQTHNVDMRTLSWPWWSPLHDAASKGYATIIEILVIAGIDVDAIHGGATPLLVASHARSPTSLDAVRMLIRLGADVNACDPYRLRPLHHAAISNSQSVVRHLFDSGADVEALDWRKQTALMLACTSGRLENVEMLVAAGADVNGADDDGLTPLHRAAQNGHAAVVRYLTSVGAYINAKDVWERTPLHLASENLKDEARGLLLEAGADATATDAKGRVADGCVTVGVIPESLV